MLIIKPLTYLITLVILGSLLLVGGYSSIYSQSYYVDDNISVPITFSSSENVTAIDFTISLNSGSLVSFTCGGAGFTKLSGTGNNCVLANLSGGAQSGTIATVVVKATQVGTLTVSASGSLSNSSGSQAANGSISGSSYTISQDPVSTPIPTPTTTTPVTNTPTETPKQDIVVDRLLLRKKDGTSLSLKDNSINIDEDAVEVIFLKSTFTDSTLLKISKNSDVTMNFKEYKEEGDSSVISKYLLPLGINIEKTLKDDSILKLEIPSNTSISAFIEKEESTNWNGGLDSPLEIASSEINYDGVNLAVMFGSNNLILVFDKPVKITLPNQTGKKVGYSQLGVISEITKKCNEQGLLPEGSNECYFDNGTDIIIYTKHFTTFFSFAPKEEVTEYPTDTTPVSDTNSVSNNKEGINKFYLIGFIVSSVLLCITLPITIIYILKRRKKSTLSSVIDSK